MSCDPIPDSVYRTLVLAVRKLEGEIEFASHDKFGWLTVCPSTIGTALDCHVRMKLIGPADYLGDISEQFHLLVTDVTGTECAEKERVIDISNKRVFGLSEFDCMKSVYYGIKEIIRRNSTEGETDVVAEEIPATTSDEPQAEISLTSVQSNGTYTKEQVELECVATPDEPAVEAENTETPIQADDGGEGEQLVEPEESVILDNTEIAEPNEEIPAVDG